MRLVLDVTFPGDAIRLMFSIYSCAFYNQHFLQPKFVLLLLPLLLRPQYFVCVRVHVVGGFG